MPEAASNSGWTRVAFGDVVRLSKERSGNPEDDGLERYVGLEHIEPGDLRIRRWGDIADGTTFTSVFRPGQVLFGKRRAYQRKVAIADFDGVCSGDIYVFQPKNERLLPELLPFICQTDAFFEHAVGTSAGSLSPRTNWSSLAGYEFALPPLKEQTRISGLLNELEHAIDRLVQLGDAMHAVHASLVWHQVGEAGFEPLDQLVHESSYGCSRLANSDGQGYPILRIPNVLRGGLDLTDLKWVQLSPSETARYIVREGDILVVRTNGNPDYVGRCLSLPKLADTCMFASYLIRLVMDTSRVRPRYVAAVVNSAPVRRALRAHIRSSAGNYNLNAKGLRATRIPLPSLEGQDELLAQLADLAASISFCASRTNDTRQLKRRVLGELMG